MIICVIGKAGSGKTTVGRVISEYTVLPLIEVSDFLKQITGGTQRHEMNLNRHVFEAENPNWLWDHIEQAINDHDGDCVISGVREPYLLHKILQLYEEVHILGVEASPFTRYSRMCNRAENGFFSVEDFRLTEDGTLEDGFIGDNTLGIDITLSKCDVMFNADQTVAEMRLDIQKYLFDSGMLKQHSKKYKARMLRSIK